MSSLNHHALLVKAYNLISSYDLGQASLICDQLVAKHRNDSKVICLQGMIAEGRSNLAEAERCFRRCIDTQPSVLDYHTRLAALLIKAGKFDRAITTIQSSLKQFPDNLELVGAMADALIRIDEFDRVRDILGPLVAQGTITTSIAAIWARLAIRNKDYAEAVRVLESKRNAPAHPSGYFFLLGDAYDRLGRLQEAFDAYSIANQKTAVRFLLDDSIDHVRQLNKAFTPALIARMARPSHTSEKPVFIVGRPRSGSTLVESILDAHPQAFGVGELPLLTDMTDSMNFDIGSIHTYPRCVNDLDKNDINILSRKYLDHVEKLAPEALRIVDKNLANAYNVGLIRILFPQASIINIRRNTIDNCWACFTSNLVHHGATQDLYHLGIVHALHVHLMNYWRAIADEVGIRMLDVDYEAVVADQEGWTRKILDFCGLPFDERCLNFHEKAREKQAVSAPTLSAQQVKQPLYKTSVGRAAKYEPFLGRLKEGLAEGERLAKTF